MRGYGAGAHRILEAIHHGAPWWSVSRSASRASAEVTHAHPEGMAGAIAVAVAAAGAYRGLRGAKLLGFVIEATPEGETRDGLTRAAALPSTEPVGAVVGELGNGSQV